MMKPGLYFAICLILLMSLSGHLLGADAVEETLQEADYPWYDSTSQQFKPVTIPKDEPLDQSEPSEISTATEGVLAVVLRVLMWSLIIVVVISLITFCVRAFYDFEPPQPEVMESGPIVTQEQLAALPEMARGVTDFLAEAKKLASAQQYSQAMIFYYSWQLVTLGNQEIVELKAGKTNRQYARETTRNRPAIQELFQQSIRKFEDAIYGGIELSHDEFLSLWQRRSQFKQSSAKSTLFTKGHE